MELLSTFSCQNELLHEINKNIQEIQETGNHLKDNFHEMIEKQNFYQMKIETMKDFNQKVFEDVLSMNEEQFQLIFDLLLQLSSNPKNIKIFIHNNELINELFLQIRELTLLNAPTISKVLEILNTFTISSKFQKNYGIRCSELILNLFSYGIQPYTINLLKITTNLCKKKEICSYFLENKLIDYIQSIITSNLNKKSTLLSKIKELITILAKNAPNTSYFLQISKIAEEIIKI